MLWVKFLYLVYSWIIHKTAHTMRQDSETLHKNKFKQLVKVVTCKGNTEPLFFHAIHYCIIKTQIKSLSKTVSKYCGLPKKKKGQGDLSY